MFFPFHNERLLFEAHKPALPDKLIRENQVRVYDGLLWHNLDFLRQFIYSHV
jgi:hypothetical protein